MSADAYVKSLAQGQMKVQRRPNISGELQIIFEDPSISPIHITNDDVVDLMKYAGVTPFHIARSNVNRLRQRFLKIVL